LSKAVRFIKVERLQQREELP